VTVSPPGLTIDGGKLDLSEAFSVVVDDADLEETIALLLEEEDDEDEFLAVNVESLLESDDERRAAHLSLRAAVWAVAIALAVVVGVLVAQAVSAVYLLYMSVSLVLGAIAWTTLVWMLHAWRTPTSLLDGGLGRTKARCAYSFSLIVPARHEEAVLEATLSRLATSHHPDVEIVVVVGSDDHATRAAAERVARRRPDRVKVVVDPSWPKSKPRALNAALPYCSGAITGVFDAEDDVHPALLERVDQCFQTTGADIVQAGVQLMNFRSSWLTVRNVLEYYFWFRSRLHFQASQGFIPLGGNTVFIRTELLRTVGGWDADCLAEDCELGVRLSSLGAKTVVFYEPELVTREECPPTLGAFARQRTRWSQGFLQTLERGYWRQLPLRQRALGAYTLAMPYLMAVVWLTIPVAIATAVVVKAPVPITLVAFLPLVPMLSMLAAEIAALGDFCRTYGQRAAARDYGRLILGVLLYQSVLAYAAARAVVRELRGERGWEKTKHEGLHLVPTAAPPRTAPSPPVVRDPPRAAPAPIDAPGRERPPAPANPIRAHADLVLVAVLLAGVALVQGTNALHWPATQFDEGTYVSNAWAVQHGALAPYTYSYGHPPLAWLLIAAWTWARGLVGDGSYSIDSGRDLMFVVTLVSCALLFMLARRLAMGRVFAAVAVLLFALSPVGLFYHRAVLLDNVAIAWVLAAFVLALSPRHRLWAFAGSGACFAAALLSKETTLVLLPALALAALQSADRRTRRYCLTLLGALLGLIALGYPLYAALKGELLPGPGHVSLLGYTVVQLVTREGTGSLFDPQSQTYAIVTAWLKLDPWLLGAALALAPIALIRRRTRAVAVAFVIQTVMVLRPGYLPNMYVIGLLPFAALIVAGTSEAIWRNARPRAIVAALALLMLAIVVPRWAHTDHAAMTERLDGPERAAKRWLAADIGHDKRVIVSDEYWLYLIEHGFDQHPVYGGFFSRTVVVYWPLDYDPAVKRRFPNGWRDFDYIVSTEAVRSLLRLTPTTARALDHSRVIKQFGHGDQRIEIRAIEGGDRFG
jgi:glycosyltransferase XagB